MSDLDLTDPFDPEAHEPRPRSLAPTPPRVPVRPAQPPAPAPAAEPVESAREGTVPWKAAASSVPKLRQQPVAADPPPADDAFPGFAQDAVSARGAAALAELPATEPDGTPRSRPSPLAAEPPFWELWLERARSLPMPVVLGAAAAVLLAVVLVNVFRPREQAIVSLGRLRQHPEAYDGRIVNVRGRAGETFTIGGSYVYHLRQGRDTIVVYSRTRRPALHENVKATGTVSIGYLDGVPRVALLEEPAAP
jgi:hypothetical protein